jgi:hypothetical protein
VKNPKLSRRQFIKMAALSMAGVALRPWSERYPARSSLLEVPLAEKLGRVLGGNVEVKARPDENSPTVKILPEDSLVVWLAEGTGSRPLWNDQRYVETPDGYIYASNLQPVANHPNEPLATLPDPLGMWVEVTVPYVDLRLANPPGRSPWLEYTSTPRLYYSQVMWADQIKTDDQGLLYYRVSDRYGSFGDYFWAEARAFRLLQPEAFSPINPDRTDKLVVVDLTYQTLACLEGDSEVYFCRVSTGPKLNSKSKSGGEWATPLGKHTIWRKLIAVHMTGGTTGGGYDLAGIGWTTLFASKGMAIHSTFWHNSFGTPQSHGCVNCKPEDALWIFRWTLPVVPTETGDITQSGQGSTKVLVKES